MRNKVVIIILALIVFLFFLIKFEISLFIKESFIINLKEITSKDASVGKIYIHLVPLYLEVNDLSLISSDGEDLKIEKIKIYFGLPKILSKELRIKRLVVYNGNFNLNYQNLEKTIKNIKNFLEKPTKIPFKILFESLIVENFSGTVIKGDLTINLSEFYSKVLWKSKPEVSLFSNIKITSSIYPSIYAKIKTLFSIEEKAIVLKEFKLFDRESMISSSGKIIYPGFLGDFLISGKIFIKSLLKLIGVEKTTKGNLNFEGNLFLEPKNNLHDFKVSLKFDGEFFLEDIMKILNVSEKLSGFTKIKNGKIEGNLNNPIITAKVNFNDGNILGVSVERAETDVVYKNKILEFKNGKVNFYNGSAEVYAWITLPIVHTHYVHINAKKISSECIFKLINWKPGIPPGDVDGWILSQGREFSPTGSFVYLRKFKETGDIRSKLEWIKGDFESVGFLYNFKNIKLATSNTLIELRGHFDSKKRYVDFQFDLKSRDLYEFFSPYQEGIHGNLDGNGRILGHLDSPEIVFDFTSPKIHVSFEEIKEIALKNNLVFFNISGKVTYKKDALLIHSLAGENLLIKGKISFIKAQDLFDFREPLYDISFLLKNIELSKFYLKEFKHEIGTSIDLEGSIRERGDIRVNLISKPLFFGGSRAFDKVEARIELQKNTLFLRTLNIYNNGNLLKASGYIVLGQEVNIKGESNEFNIMGFVEKYLREIKATHIEKIVLKNLNFEIRGLLENPILKTNASIVASLQKKKSINGILNLKLEKNYILVDSNFTGNINLKIEGFTDKNKWFVNGEFNSARIDLFASAFTTNLPSDFVVMIDGHLKGEITNKIFNSQIHLNKIFMKIYGIGLSNRDLINIDIKDNKIFFKPITLVGQSTELTIKGKVVDYFDILIEGSTELKPLKSLFKFDDLRGRAFMQIYIYESKKNPEIVGAVDLIDTSLTIRKDIPTFSNVNATLSFNENRIVIEKASGIFSEGQIHTDGTIYLEKLMPRQLALSCRFSQVRWIITPGCMAFFDGQIYLTGSYDQPLVSGQINIKRGIYAERIDWTKFAIRSTSTKNIVPKDSLFNNLKFNLRVQTDNFFVNNNLATVNLNSDILLKGMIMEPSLIGWINAKDGWIYFRGNRFEILRLLIQFNDPSDIRPYLSISARTSISQYNILLSIVGFIDQFNLTLTSNPPLADQDLLNLLILGENGSIRKEASGLSEAASFITGQMHSIIEERIRSITGLDVMSVEPTLSKTTGSIAPRITFGKRLMDGKMTVTYSAVAGTTGEQIIKVEYFLKKGISLIGIRDELGGISGAIKFRFEFN